MELALPCLPLEHRSSQPIQESQHPFGDEKTDSVNFPLGSAHTTAASQDINVMLTESKAVNPDFCVIYSREARAYLSKSQSSGQDNETRPDIISCESSDAAQD